MSDIALTGGVSSSALENIHALEGSLQTRLGGMVPEALDQDGNIDWKALGGLRLAREAGSVVMALAVADVMNDFVGNIAAAEAEGRTDRAVELLNRSDEAQAVAISVLKVATESLFDGADTPGRYITRDGEVVTEGQTLREFSDVVTLRLYEAQVTPNSEQAFIDSTVMPMIELVRDGFKSEAALAVVDMSADLDCRIADLVSVATRHQMDLNDEFDRHRLLTVVKFAGGLEKVHVFINPVTGEIDARVFEEPAEEKRDEEDNVDIEEDDEPQLLRRTADDEEPEQEPSDDWIFEDEEADDKDDEKDTTENEEPDEEADLPILDKLDLDL